MYVIKYKLDETTPYVMRGLLRVDNINLAKQFADVDSAMDMAKSYGYAPEDVIIVNI